MRSAILILFFLPTLGLAADYYLSDSKGDDSAPGTSPAQAWKSIARASQVRYEAGDRLLLRSGDHFSGSLQLGAEDRVLEGLTIDCYQDGDAPTIDGQGADACIHLVNPSGVTVRSLALQNEKGKYGLRFTGRNAGRLGSVTIEDLAITKIYQAAWSAPEDAAHDEKKYYGGINAEVLRGSRPTWWEGVVIRDCTLHDLGTCGISIGSAYPLHEQRRARRRREPFPIKGVIIENNRFRNTARDGAIIRQCQGALLQHNEVTKTGRVSTSNGIWFWDCQDSVIRHNVGSRCGTRNRSDGSPFSIDYFSQGCVIEFNYSHDNEGPGFMAFGNHGTGTGSVIRGNLSYNDGTAEAKPGFGAVSMVSELKDTRVENNIVIAGPDTRVLMGHHDWQGLPEDVLYRGNLFVGNGKAEIESSVLQGGRFVENLVLNVPNLPSEALEGGDGTDGRRFMKAMQRRQELQERAGPNDTQTNP